MNATENTEPRIFKVPEPRMPELKRRLEKLNKRAKKLGTRQIDLSEVGRETEEVAEPDGRERVPTGEIRTTLLLTFEGERPILNGWEFLAKIEPLDGESNLIKSVPGASLEGVDLTPYRDTAMDCDHCNLSRRRLSTFLIRHEDGEIKLVGRNCLQDFTGHTSPENLIASCEFLLNVDDLLSGFEGEGWGFGGFETAVDPVTFLGWVGRAVSKWGWISRGKARDSFTPMTATVDEVAMMLFPGTHPAAQERARDMREEVGAPTDSDKAEAEAALEWAASQDPRPDQDYLWNIKILSGAEGWTSRHFGLGGSIMAAYRRHMDNLKRAERRAKSSAHRGEIKERLRDLCLTVDGWHRMDSAWGTILLTFVDDSGNVFKWWASPSAATEDLKVGQRVTLTGTVKKHNNFRGVAETVLSRCKVEVIPEAP